MQLSGTPRPSITRREKPNEIVFPHRKGRMPTAYALQTVEKPLESSRGPKPSRISIVPSGMYGGHGRIFAAENPIFQSKNRSLAVFAPGNLKDFSKNW